MVELVRIPREWGRGHHLDPLIGADSPGGDDLANPVVQDLGRGARQTADSGLFQFPQVVVDAQAGLPGTVKDFFRGKGVQVDCRRRLLYRPAELDVVAPVHAGGQARLDADLGGAEALGFQGPPDDFLGRKMVALGAGRRAAEGAEAASLDADVGEVDVAIHHVGHIVPHRLPSQEVGGLEQHAIIDFPGLEETDHLRLRGVPALQAALNGPGHRRRRLSQGGFHRGLAPERSRRFPLGQHGRFSQSGSSSAWGTNPSASASACRRLPKAAGRPLFLFRMNSGYRAKRALSRKFLSST